LLSKAAEVVTEFEYWNAAGVLLVHAAIALTDALTVKVGGVKSAGGDHMLAAALSSARTSAQPRRTLYQQSRYESAVPVQAN
jgi:hypothetical protein